MKCNESPIDRFIRAVIGLTFLGMGLFVMRGWLRVIVGLAGVVALISAATGFCHVYKVLGDFSTAKKA